MNHLFNVEVATDIGVNAAIILENIAYWIGHNQANETHFFDGKYWTYNSLTAFESLFPYLSKKQIRSALDKLVEDDLVIVGEHNDDPMNHTKWYALTEKAANMLKMDISTNCPPGHIDLPARAHHIDSSIYIYNNTNINKKESINSKYSSSNNINQHTIYALEKAGKKSDIETVKTAWNCLEPLGIKPIVRLSPGTNRYKMLEARIAEYGLDGVLKAIDNVSKSSYLQGKKVFIGWFDFEWFVRPNNFPKVIEGKYTDKECLNASSGSTDALDDF